MGSEVIIAPAAFTMVGFIVWTIVTGWQRHLQVKHMAEFNGRLVERLGSVKDLSEFLQTDGGAKMLNSLTIERVSTSVRERVLRGSAIGVVCIALSLGFLVLGRMFMWEDHEGFTIIGVIALSLGLGFVVSSMVSYFLAKALRILDASADRSTGSALR
jgi:membrane-bound ClpP family serine protease